MKESTASVKAVGTAQVSRFHSFPNAVFNCPQHIAVMPRGHSLALKHEHEYDLK